MLFFLGDERKELVGDLIGAGGDEPEGSEGNERAELFGILDPRAVDLGTARGGLHCPQKERGLPTDADGVRTPVAGSPDAERDVLLAERAVLEGDGHGESYGAFDPPDLTAKKSEIPAKERRVAGHETELVGTAAHSLLGLVFFDRGKGLSTAAYKAHDANVGARKQPFRRRHIDGRDEDAAEVVLLCKLADLFEDGAVGLAVRGVEEKLSEGEKDLRFPATAFELGVCHFLLGW